MKKLLAGLATALCLIVFAAGCDSPLEPEIVEPHLAVLSMTGQQQRLAFSMLSPVEKALAWQHRLSNVFTHEFNSASKTRDEDERRALFREYEQIVTDPANFAEDRSNDRLAELEVILLDWHERAEEVFSAEEIFGLLFVLSNESALVVDSGEKAELQRPCLGCCCSIGSSMTCPQITLSLAGAEIKYGSCWAGWNCSEGTSSGCGAGWLHPCDGSLCEF